MKRNQTAYELDLMTFDKQVITCPFSDIQLPCDTGVVFGDYITINNSEPMPTSLVEFIKGQFSIASDNTRTGAESKRLLSIAVKFNIEMYFRH
jgi:hypothetical protein